MTTTTAIAPQAVETACDECAGDGQLAYDLEASMWVPRSATADWPADDCIGNQCARLPAMRRHRHGAARSRTQSSNEIRVTARAWAFRKTIATATAPFHRRAEDLDWQAALLPRVRLVSGRCRASACSSGTTDGGFADRRRYRPKRGPDVALAGDHPRSPPATGSTVPVM